MSRCQTSTELETTSLAGEHETRAMTSEGKAVALPPAILLHFLYTRRQINTRLVQSLLNDNATSMSEGMNLYKNANIGLFGGQIVLIFVFQSLRLCARDILSHS